MRSMWIASLAAAMVACVPGARAQAPNWVTSWTGSAQGPYPVGYASAQPNLGLAFPDPAAGARDQTFRLMVHPGLWGRSARLRLSNVHGTRPVTFDRVFAGEQAIAGTLVAGSNAAVAFGGRGSVTVPAGESVWSDAVDLAFVHDPAEPSMAGRRLAVSLHVVGESGPMTWHAKALTTSYVTAPDVTAEGVTAAGVTAMGADAAADEGDDAFRFATTSWYFLDAVDMAAPAGTRLVVAFGDSITDGTDSTLNGDDRWPDVLGRRLMARYGGRVVVVNQGIGGNRVVGPAVYTPERPFAGGPAAEQRVERDVLQLSGVSSVIWMEGTNDFGRGGEGATPEQVEAGVAEVVGRVRARLPGVRVIGATLTPDLHSSNPEHGSSEEAVKILAYNDFVRTTMLFDAVVDFNSVALDAASGEMRAEFVPDNTVGGPGDKLHPNRAGYRAMADSIDLGLLAP
jgi:lysophospholipase L1-like esterase